MNAQKESSLPHERRHNHRALVAVRVTVRNADFGDGEFAQVTYTRDASSKGFYFHDPIDRYHSGMRLHVTVPYHTGMRIVELHETCEVVRVDRSSGLPNGIAVKRHSASHARGLAVTPRRDLMDERRAGHRFPFVATVEMRDLKTQTTTTARTSDLSRSGCYIDTLNPFPVNATLDLRIQKANESLHVRAGVRTQHMGSGMGLVFTDLPRDQHAVVRDWLSDSNSTNGQVRAMEGGIHMSRVYDKLREAEQIRKLKDQVAAHTFSESLEVAPVKEMSLAPIDLDTDLSITAYLGPGIRVRGEITGSEHLYIDGRVEGRISIGDCRLTIGQSAYVGAEILAGEVWMYGEVAGQVLATERIVVKKDACVSGDLTSARTVIEEGAFIRASIQMGNDANLEAAATASAIGLVDPPGPEVAGSAKLEVPQNVWGTGNLPEDWNHADGPEISKGIAWEREVTDLLALVGSGSYYQLLGVTSKSSQVEVRSRYYELMRKFHPDYHMERPERMRSLHKITEALTLAYSTLTDEVARQEYDELMADGDLDGQWPD